MATQQNGWSVADQRAKDEQKNKELRERLMQGAALAMRMNDQTALGYGLGTLLFSNWDKWFGGKGGNKTDGQGGNGQYDFSKNIADAKDPMQFAINGGDPHAKWAAEHNKPFSLMAVVQNPATIGAAPMPTNLTVDGVNPQAPAAGNTLQSGIPLTQQLTINGQNAGVVDPNKTMMDSNYNPANFANFAKEMGASTSPWSNAQNYQLADTDFLKKKYPWEVQ